MIFFFQQGVFAMSKPTNYNFTERVEEFQRAADEKCSIPGKFSVTHVVRNDTIYIPKAPRHKTP